MGEETCGGCASAHSCWLFASLFLQKEAPLIAPLWGVAERVARRLYASRQGSVLRSPTSDGPSRQPLRCPTPLAACAKSFRRHCVYRSASLAERSAPTAALSTYSRSRPSLRR